MSHYTKSFASDQRGLSLAYASGDTRDGNPRRFRRYDFTVTSVVRRATPLRHVAMPLSSFRQSFRSRGGRAVVPDGVIMHRVRPIPSPYRSSREPLVMDSIDLNDCVTISLAVVSLGFWSLHRTQDQGQIPRLEVQGPFSITA